MANSNCHIGNESQNSLWKSAHSLHEIRIRIGVYACKYKKCIKNIYLLMIMNLYSRSSVKSDLKQNKSIHCNAYLSCANVSKMVLNYEIRRSYFHIYQVLEFGRVIEEERSQTP